MYTHHQHDRGFIALMSILILSTVLLGVTLSLAQFGIASRFFILDLEHKSVSEKLAEACVHVARVQAYNDPAYEADTPITYPIGDRTCTVVRVDADGSVTTIEATGMSGNAITNVRVTVRTTTGDFLTWEELVMH